MRLCKVDAKGDPIEEMSVHDEVEFKGTTMQIVEIVQPRWGARNGAVVLNNGIAYEPKQFDMRWFP